MLNDGNPVGNSQVCVHEREKEEPGEDMILSAVSCCCSSFPSQTSQTSPVQSSPVLLQLSSILLGLRSLTWSARQVQRPKVHVFSAATVEDPGLQTAGHRLGTTVRQTVCKCFSSGSGAFRAWCAVVR